MNFLGELFYLNDAAVLPVGEFASNFKIFGNVLYVQFIVLLLKIIEFQYIPSRDKTLCV